MSQYEQQKQTQAPKAAPSIGGRGRPSSQLMLRARANDVLQRTEGLEAQQAVVSPDNQDALAEQGMATPSVDLPHQGVVERGLGADLSGLTAHVDDASTDAMGAHAYMKGDHAVFSSDASVEDVTHEAAHYLQQNDGVQQRSAEGEAGGVEAGSAPGAGPEAEAEAAAQTVASGGTFRVGGQHGAGADGVQQRTRGDEDGEDTSRDFDNPAEHISFQGYGLQHGNVNSYGVLGGFDLETLSNYGYTWSGQSLDMLESERANWVEAVIPQVQEFLSISGPEQEDGLRPKLNLSAYMQLGIPQLDKSEFMSRPHRNPGWDYMDIRPQSYGADVALDEGTFLDCFFNEPTHDGKNFVTQFVVGNEVGDHWATVTGWLKIDATGRTQVTLTANDPSWHVANGEKGYVRWMDSADVQAKRKFVAENYPVIMERRRVDARKARRIANKMFMQYGGEVNETDRGNDEHRENHFGDLPTYVDIQKFKEHAVSGDSAEVKDAFAKYGGEEGDGVHYAVKHLLDLKTGDAHLRTSLITETTEGGGVTWKTESSTLGKDDDEVGLTYEFESGSPGMIEEGGVGQSYAFLNLSGSATIHSLGGWGGPLGNVRSGIGALGGLLGGDVGEALDNKASINGRFRVYADGTFDVMTFSVSGQDYTEDATADGGVDAHIHTW